MIRDTNSTSVWCTWKWLDEIDRRPYVLRPRQSRPQAGRDRKHGRGRPGWPNPYRADQSAVPARRRKPPTNTGPVWKGRLPRVGLRSIDPVFMSPSRKLARNCLHDRLSVMRGYRLGLRKSPRSALARHARVFVRRCRHALPNMQPQRRRYPATYAARL
jgi:hypothetical protein